VGKRPWLDTNYIFGLLDLHDNFFVQASKLRQSGSRPSLGVWGFGRIGL